MQEAGITYFIQIHPLDNVLVALTDLPAGFKVDFNGKIIDLLTPVAAKHKFTLQETPEGGEIFMYGVLVGKTSRTLAAGTAITVDNVVHAAGGYQLGERKTEWHQPDISAFAGKTFMGYHRGDGSVGTAN
ncbi:MAG TPA: SAF domain-containing protein, partial [Pedobacter sp.]